MNLIEQFRAARRAAVPIVSISTADPTALISEIAASQKDDVPMIRWTFATGLQAFNKAGQAALASLPLSPDEAKLAARPDESLALALKLPPKTIVFMLQAHRIADDPYAACGVWLARDQYKTTGRTLVLLSPGFTPPAELAQDVIALDEPLPDAAQLAAIVASVAKGANAAQLTTEATEEATAALTGLSAFQAEQVTAMSLLLDTKAKTATLDLAQMWQRKRRTISDTPGLSVYSGPERFADIGGQANLKSFLGSILKGERAPRSVVIIDEIEKALGGAGTDTSGVSTDQLGVLLTTMADAKSAGVLLLGPPGAGKSIAAKAAANEAAALGIQFDLGGMKSSLVGSSEQRIRQALKVIDAVSSGRPLYIATCNSVAALPPELLRRFNLARFFVDLPDADERAVIWKIHRKKYGIKPKDPGIELDSGWTGAEIENACDLASRLNCTLQSAAQYVVPIARSAKDKIEALRANASGHFISASAGGPYLKTTTEIADIASPGERKISYELED